MTEFINGNAAAVPDLAPLDALLALSGADTKGCLLLSYAWGNNGAFVCVRANGTALNPSPPAKDNLLGVFGTGGYVGAGNYSLGAGGVAVWADENWSQSGTGTYVSIDTRARGAGIGLAPHRIHITSDGITINDANGLEPTGGRLGVGTLNLAGAVGINGATIASTGASTLWTPSDQSGAALVFANVSTQFYQLGPLVFAYGTLTYPATGSPAAAKISLPVAVPNQNYARSPCAAFGPVVGLTLRALQNQSVAAFEAGGVAVTNAGLTGAIINFMLTYPAS